MIIYRQLSSLEEKIIKMKELAIKEYSSDLANTRYAGLFQTLNTPIGIDFNIIELEDSFTSLLHNNKIKDEDIISFSFLTFCEQALDACLLINNLDINHFKNLINNYKLKWDNIFALVLSNSGLKDKEWLFNTSKWKQNNYVDYFIWFLHFFIEHLTNQKVKEK